MVLHLKQLSVSLNNTPLVTGVNLSLEAGECAVVMGPNGAGKSSLFLGLAGHPKYDVTAEEYTLDQHDLLALKAPERAQAGLFLMFQHPAEIPGLSVRSFLFAARNAQREKRGESRLDPIEFEQELMAAVDEVAFPVSLLDRSLHDRFSGGEKKRSEMLQIELLQPRMLLLDEPDSGLDRDALHILTSLIARARSRGAIVLLVTHYPDLARQWKPDQGLLVQNGTAKVCPGLGLVERIQKHGFVSDV